VITYPQFIRSFLETVARSRAARPLATKEGRTMRACRLRLADGWSSIHE
jgi:hypothetical protein